MAVIGGDWNDVMDMSYDRWRQTGQSAPCLTTKLNSLVGGLGWIDTWRALHGMEQSYTYFSSVHASFSRLDYLFVPAVAINRLGAADILPRGLSDHSPVALTLQLGPVRPPFRWRLSTWHLQDEQYREHLESAIDQYLSLNIGSVVAAKPLWEAMKATIRGVDISYCSAVRRARKEELLKSEAHLVALEWACGEERGGD